MPDANQHLEAEAAGGARPVRYRDDPARLRESIRIRNEVIDSHERTIERLESKKRHLEEQSKVSSQHSRYVDTIRNILAVSEGITPEEYEAAVDALGRLEEQLEVVQQALRRALEHIEDDLQPAFASLAETGKLPWPSAWSETPYDETQAAQRLATWWHGVGIEDLLEGTEESDVAKGLL